MSTTSADDTTRWIAKTDRYSLSELPNRRYEFCVRDADTDSPLVDTRFDAVSETAAGGYLLLDATGAEQARISNTLLPESVYRALGVLAERTDDPDD